MTAWLIEHREALDFIARGLFLPAAGAVGFASVCASLAAIWDGIR